MEEVSSHEILLLMQKFAKSLHINDLFKYYVDVVRTHVSLGMISYRRLLLLALQHRSAM
jgi:hypothetical protein